MLQPFWLACQELYSSERSRYCKRLACRGGLCEVVTPMPRRFGGKLISFHITLPLYRNLHRVWLVSGRSSRTSQFKKAALDSQIRSLCQYFFLFVISPLRFLHYRHQILDYSEVQVGFLVLHQGFPSSPYSCYSHRNRLVLVVVTIIARISFVSQ